jgi:hypothetical protein
MVYMLADLFNTRPQMQVLWFSAGFLSAIHAIGRDNA